MNRTTLLLLGLIGALGIASCKRDVPVRPQDLAAVRIFAKSATVTEPLDVITVAEVRMMLARARLEREESLTAAPLPKELAATLLSMMIDDRLLSLEARRLGVRASTTAIAKDMADLEERMSGGELDKRLIDAYQTRADLEEAMANRIVAGEMMTRARKAVTVSDDEVMKAWSEMPPEAKQVKARVHASQIVVPTEEQGEEIVGRLKKGESFEALAQELSIGPESEQGGDLGWFERGTMPTVFDEICFSLKPGEISRLNPSEYGFHIFRIHERQEARPLEFDAAKSRIRMKLLQEKMAAAEIAHRADLRARVRIEKDEQVLATIE